MKVSLFLLVISLVIASYNAATINLAVLGGAACIGSTGCTLGAGIFAGGALPGANDDLVLDAGLFSTTSKLLVNVNSALTVRSVQITGAGSQLVVQAGASLTTAANVTVGASAQLVVAGSATINGVIAVADGTAGSLSTITISGVVFANGGINMAGSNSQLSVSGSASTRASLTISASSVLRGTINWATNAAIVIQGGTTAVYASFTASANVTVQTVLAVYSSTATTTSATATYQLSSGFLYLSGADAVVNASVAATTSAIVRGTGTITGDLALSLGAQISVGDSPGTQYVNGNFQQDGTTTFNLEVASSSNFDRLVVRGNVAINGFLKVIQYNGYSAGKSESYRFITAAGAISGKYSTVYSDPVLQSPKYSAGNDNTAVIAYYNNNASAAVVSIMVLAVACVVSMF